MGAHCNQPGHPLANLGVTILEQIKFTSKSYRKERESYVINKFNTNHKGVNNQNLFLQRGEGREAFQRFNLDGQTSKTPIKELKIKSKICKN